MKLSTVLIFCLLLPAPVLADDHAQHNHNHSKKEAAKTELGGGSRLSEKGLYQLEMAVGGKQLKLGPNALDIRLRDKAGKPVTAAEITVTPWMPQMGHGVWDKPVVTERPGGIYHVENVVIIMGGRWDLKFAIRKDSREDRAVFSYDVAESAPVSKQDSIPSREGYQRTIKNYTVPNVTLLNQDGKRVKLKSLVDSGRPVIINFIFTTCTTICPVLSAGFSNLQTELGPQAEKVQLISISIDPEHDRPPQLKEYAKRFSAAKGWDLLTGSREDIGRVLKAFDAFVVDKMSHDPLYIFRAPNSEEWVRVKGLASKADLLKEYRRIENR